MATVFYQWPEEVIALNAELASGLHQKLEAILSTLSNETSIPERIAHVAAYCEIMVDKIMDSEELCDFCELLRVRLIDRREKPDDLIQIILPLPPRIQ